MWADFQLAFYIVMGQFISDVLLPVFVAAGVLLAVIMPASRFWQPTEKITIVPGWDREES